MQVSQSRVNKSQDIVNSRDMRINIRYNVRFKVLPGCSVDTGTYEHRLGGWLEIVENTNWKHIDNDELVGENNYQCSEVMEMTYCLGIPP